MGGDYFGSDFFGQAGPGPSIPDDADGPEDPPLTDLRALQWVKGQLEGSKWFSSVFLGRNAAGSGDRWPSAWIWPASYRETDDGDPIMITRTLNFFVVVTAREPEDLDTLATLDRLSNAVADLVADGPPGCLPGRSGVEAGKYEMPPNPEQTNPIKTGSYGLSITLAGSIAYLISGRSGRDARGG